MADLPAPRPRPTRLPKSDYACFLLRFQCRARFTAAPRIALRHQYRHAGRIAIAPLAGTVLSHLLHCKMGQFVNCADAVRRSPDATNALTGRPRERGDPYAVSPRLGSGAVTFANHKRRGLWVPAFAGTTAHL